MLVLMRRLPRLVRLLSLDQISLLALLSGLAAGLSLPLWCHHLVGLWGASLPTQSGMLAGMAVGFTAGGWAMQRVRIRRIDPLLGFALGCFCLAAWTLALPLLLSAVEAGLGNLPATFADPPDRLALVAALLAGLLCALPTAAAVTLPAWLTSWERRTRLLAGSATTEPAGISPVFATFALGVGLGSYAFGHGAAAILGVQGTGLLTVLIATGLFIHTFWMATSRGFSLVSLDTDADFTADDAATRSATISGGREARVAGVQLAIIGAACGGGLAAWSRIVQQLAPVTASFAPALWGAVAIGMALGYWAAQRTSAERRAGARSWTGMAVIVVMALVPALFPGLVSQLLWVNSRVSSAWLLLVLRGTLPALLALPLGAVWGLYGGSSARTRGQPRIAAWAAAAAWLFVDWRLIPTLGPATPLLMAAAVLLLGLALEFVRGGVAATGWPRRVACGSLCLLLAAAPFWRAGYQPQLSARLLFSTNVLSAAAGNQPRALLPFLDEGRPLTVAEGERGTFTLWKFAGSQYQLRENGVPKAVVSTDTEIFPQYSAEVLPGILPLVLHERPDRVLLLGLGGGVPLQTCLDAPVLQVTCTEADRGLTRLVRDFISPRPSGVALHDDRLTLRTIDPALFVVTSHETFDVIVSTPDQSALARCAPYYTREFYNRVAARLAPGGIFCQRFQYVDYGAAPLQTLARTLQAEFRNVIALEMAPGELLCLATNDERGLVRKGLLARVQAPHVREATGQIGWDWSILLTLGAYDQSALETVTAGDAVSLNTVANGRFAFGLPYELMRWGPKQQEVQKLLTGKARRLLDWMGTDAENPALLRRLSEVQAQHELIVKYPDQYWAYRKSVREQVSQRPKSLLNQVNYETRGGLDPEDRRRMQYFAALGTAAQSRQLSDIERVAKFRSPFDPLLTLFLQAEVAELYGKTGHANPRQELRHRLYVLHFSSSHDRAVHNATNAIDLLIEHPEAVIRPDERWDHLNALLQLVATRWQVRAASSPGIPKDMLRDVDLTIVAAEKAFDTLGRLREAAGIPAREWEARKDYLERNLMRGLRTYRTELIRYMGRESVLAEYADDEPAETKAESLKGAAAN